MSTVTLSGHTYIYIMLMLLVQLSWMNLEYRPLALWHRDKEIVFRILAQANYEESSSDDCSEEFDEDITVKYRHLSRNKNTLPGR